VSRIVIPFKKGKEEGGGGKKICKENLLIFWYTATSDPILSKLYIFFLFKVCLVISCLISFHSLS